MGGCLLCRAESSHQTCCDHQLQPVCATLVPPAQGWWGLPGYPTQETMCFCFMPGWLAERSAAVPTWGVARLHANAEQSPGGFTSRTDNVFWNWPLNKPASAQATHSGPQGAPERPLSPLGLKDSWLSWSLTARTPSLVIPLHGLSFRKAMLPRCFLSCVWSTYQNSQLLNSL